MKHIRITILRAVMLLICLLLSGCGGEEYTYQPDHDLKPGPGLLSGKEGEFTLIGTPRSEMEQARQEKKEQEKQEEKQ